MARTSIGVLLVCVALVGCFASEHEVPTEQRNAFVTRFLDSIRDGSRFHRDFLFEDDASVTERVRPLLNRPFQIDRWDGPFLNDECYVKLADGSILVLYVEQQKHQVKSVRLALFAPEALSR